MPSNVVLIGGAEVESDFSRAAAGLPTVTFETSRAVGEQIREAWYGIAASAGINPAGLIAGRPWAIHVNTVGSWEPVTNVRISGPMHLVLAPTRPHWIYARGDKRSNRYRAGGKRGMTLPQGVRTAAYHPGTRGKIAVWPTMLKAGQMITKRTYETSTKSFLNHSFTFGK